MFHFNEVPKTLKASAVFVLRVLCLDELHVKAGERWPLHHIASVTRLHIEKMLFTWVTEIIG